MVDELKSIKDSVFKMINGMTSQVVGDDDEIDELDEEARRSLNVNLTRDLLLTLISRAGKSKDEIVQILCREIGQAVAAMLKEPLAKVAESKRLKITFELVDKNADAESPSKRPSAAKKKKSNGKKA